MLLNVLHKGEVVAQVHEGVAFEIGGFYVMPAAAGLTFGEYEMVEAPAEPPPPPTKQELSGYAAQKRYEKEIGGTIWNGWPVHTDRESQSKIIAERLAIEAGERNDPDGWKFSDGVFRMVSNDDFTALASAVRQHIRDCFELEAAILAQIEAGMITEYSQIDAAFDQEAAHG